MESSHNDREPRHSLLCLNTNVYVYIVQKKSSKLCGGKVKFKRARDLAALDAGRRTCNPLRILLTFSIRVGFHKPAGDTVAPPSVMPDLLSSEDYAPSIQRCNHHGCETYRSRAAPAN